MRAGFVILIAACGSSAVTTTTPPPPANVQPPPAAVALVPRGSIAAGAHHACAITAAGHVTCWGQGGEGRLGTPGKADQLAPVEVPKLDDVAGIAAGTDMTCAWTAKGAVWCWGGDSEGDDHAPRRVAQLHDIVQVVTGFDGACGLHASGEVACWRRDAWRDPLFPAAEDVPGFANLVEIAGDDQHLCGRTATNDVVCSVIPDDKHFRLREQKPTVLPELAGATSLAGAHEQFAAVLPGKRLATWDMADIEHRRSPERPKPIEIHTGIAAQRVYAGGTRTGRVTACVLGGADRCWTLEDFDDVTGQRKLDGIRDVSIGEDVSCARRGDRVECWGLVGRLGDGGSELPAEFVAVKGITDAVQLEAGGDNACVLRASGRVACWGGREAVLPGGAPVIDHEPVELPGVTDAIEIAMSYDTICARRKGGDATCWTAEFEGGAWRTHVSSRLAGATRLLSGLEVCGIQPNGDVRCTNAAVPAMHPPELEKQLHDSLAAGTPCVKSEHGDDACFRGAGAITIQHTQNYDVWCSVVAGKIACHYGSDPKRVFEPIEKLDHVVSWDGEYALLANGTVRSRGTAVAPIDTLANVVELRASFRGLCARHRDGTVACWGQRDYLGAGQRGTPGSPVTVAKLVMGAPRTVTPGPADVVREVTPGGPTTEIRGSAMQGPFKDGAAACAAQPCASGMRRDCGEFMFDDEAYAMPTPPAPFSAAQLVSYECRDPQYRRDDSHHVRLLVTRPDGAWLSAPMFDAGGNEKYCSAIIEPRWQTRDVVAGGSPEIVLSVVGGTQCGGVNGGSREDVAMLVVAGNGAAKPFATAPIVTGIHQDSSCPDDERSCTPDGVTVQLVATFGADGRLTIAGPASWPAIRRDKTGAIEGLERDKTAAPPLGTYRFVAK